MTNAEDPFACVFQEVCVALQVIAKVHSLVSLVGDVGIV